MLERRDAAATSVTGPTDRRYGPDPRRGAASHVRWERYGRSPSQGGVRARLRRIAVGGGAGWPNQDSHGAGGTRCRRRGSRARGCSSGRTAPRRRSGTSVGIVQPIHQTLALIRCQVGVGHNQDSLCVSHWSTLLPGASFGVRSRRAIHCGMSVEIRHVGNRNPFRNEVRRVVRRQIVGSSSMRPCRWAVMLTACSRSQRGSSISAALTGGASSTETNSA